MPKLDHWGSKVAPKGGRGTESGVREASERRKDDQNRAGRVDLAGRVIETAGPGSGESAGTQVEIGGNRKRRASKTIYPTRHMMRSSI